MATTENIILILIVIPVYQLLYYTVQLFSVSRKHPWRNYLGLLLMVMAVFLIINAWNTLGNTGGSLLLKLSFFPLLLLIGPLFYLFILSLAGHGHRPHPKKWILVFAPIPLLTLVVLIMHLSFADNVPDYHARSNIFSLHASEEGFWLWATGAGLLFTQLFFLTNLVLPYFSRGIQMSLAKIPSLSFIKPYWLTIMSIGVFVFIFSGIFAGMVFLNEKLPEFVIMNFLLFLGGGAAGHYGLKLDNLFRQVAWLENPKVEYQTGSDSLYADNRIKENSPAPSITISPQEVEDIRESLGRLMDQHKPYRNSGFNLGDLSEMLNTNKRKVSYVINEVMKKNFYGVINEYRVKESMRILQESDSDKYKMESIAQMSGFSSKSTFYACFRKYTSMTPTEYKEGLDMDQSREKMIS